MTPFDKLNAFLEAYEGASPSEKAKVFLETFPSLGDAATRAEFQRWADRPLAAIDPARAMALMERAAALGLSLAREVAIPQWDAAFSLRGGGHLWLYRTLDEIEAKIVELEGADERWWLLRP